VNQENLTAAPKIKTVPDLLRKEALAAIVVLSLVFLVSAVWDAPIEGPADPGGIPAEHVKAPWIFVGIQQLLRYLPAVLAGVLVPVTVLIVLGFLPWTRPVGPRVRTVVFFGILFAFLLLTIWGYYR
jgi:ubiquinol-cytochrome c reductase cytochrome b subunit